MADQKNYNFIYLILIGVMIGIFLAPYLNQKKDEVSNTLIQYVDNAMSGAQGEVLEIKEIPGTNLSAIKVLYDFERSSGERIREILGAIVENSSKIGVRDKVNLVEIVHFNNSRIKPLWTRHLKIRDFEAFDNR